MELNQNPSPLVIPSHLSADRAVQHWMQQNQLDVVKDAAGLAWHIQVEMREVPDAVDHRQAIIELTVKVVSSGTAEQLVTTATLNAVDDARIISMLGDAKIPFSRKPIYFEARSMDEARRWLSEKMIEIGKEMRSSAFHEVKRNLVGKWVDAKGVFGREHLSLSNQVVAPNPLTQKRNMK